MQLAHESIMTGHLSVTSSVHKVLSEYYLPGIYKDVKRFVQSCEVCISILHKGKMDRKLSSRESMIKGEECGVQQQQMNETSQVSETTDDLTSLTTEEHDIMVSATFMVKVGVCQTFQEGECSTKRKDTLQEQMCMTSHVKVTLDDVTSANVSALQMEQKGNEALMEDGRKTYACTKKKIVSICNSADGCRAKADDFNRKGVLV